MALATQTVTQLGLQDSGVAKSLLGPKGNGGVALLVAAGKRGLDSGATVDNGLASSEPMMVGIALWLASCTMEVSGLDMLQLVEPGGLKDIQVAQSDGHLPELKDEQVAR
ncbi:hypothetical protein CEK25_012341 [Fusarium fujikuroi]|nr:hypothetical protein CEK25_012341 [Fusarium fujikuroi]